MLIKCISEKGHHWLRWWFVTKRATEFYHSYQNIPCPSGWYCKSSDISRTLVGNKIVDNSDVQYIPRNMHTVFALLCFVVVIHWLIFPYPSDLLHRHCGNLTIAPVPAKQPWWIWINTSCEFIMNDCITTTKPSTTKPCAYFLGYTVACLRCSNYIFILNLTPGFNGLSEDNCKRIQETFKFWDSVRLILEVLRYLIWVYLVCNDISTWFGGCCIWPL